MDAQEFLDAHRSTQTVPGSSFELVNDDSPKSSEGYAWAIFDGRR